MCVRKKNNQFFTDPIKLALLILLCIVMIFSSYAFAVYQNLQSEIITLLSETTKHTATALEEKISSDKTTVQNVALAISNERLNTDDYLHALNKITIDNHYLRMGIIHEDYSVMCTDNAFTKLPDRKYIKDAYQGIVYVSDPLIDIADGNPIIVYGAPIYDHNWTSVKAVLFGTFSINEYQKNLSIDIFNSRGCSFIIKQCGTVVSSSCSAIIDSKSPNLFEHLLSFSKNSTIEIEQFKKNISENETGYCQLYNSPSNSTPENMYFYHTPLNVNDWYLVTAVPIAALNNRMIETLSSTFILACIIVIITGTILLILVFNLKKSKAELENIVYTNEVTGHMSYQKFKQDSQSILLNNPTLQFAIITFDIDKFKYINDMFGYSEGDNLIRYIDSVLRNNCRQNEITAHVSADDFVLLAHFTDRMQLCNRLDNLLQQFEEHSRPNNSYYNISVAIGVYEITDGDTDIDAMKDRAGIPMKKVKTNKTASYGFYDESNRKQILFERELENKMNEALLNHEFIINYQPKYDTIKQTVCGAEALIRWRQKDGSLLMPYAFIPLFEDNGFIIQLDEYVFKQVCLDIKKWIDKGYTIVPISCNLSRKNIAVNNLADTYESIIKEVGIDPSYISLELTESAFIENDSLIQNFVAKLNSKHFKVIMDDFGVGFSSIGLLKDINVHTLKLDRSFVTDITENIKTRNIVETIIKLMRQWNVRVNAEGVETIEQLECLTDLKCDEVQGYYYSKPISIEEFEKKLYRK